MACPLLEKLAPETRNLIYEYALTFDTPLQHVQQMRPFIEKFGDTDWETRAALSEEHPAVSVSHRANTSILTSSKLIYTEAIVAFYKSNFVTIDPRMFGTTTKHRQIERILATDLALATQVVTKLRLSFGTAKEAEVVLGGSTNLLIKGYPKMFPKLRAGRVNIYTDAGPRPVLALFVAADAMRHSGIFHTVQFEGVGSVAAYPNAYSQMKMMVRSQTSIDNWENDEIGPTGFPTMSVRELHRNSEGMPPGTVVDAAQVLFNSGQDGFLPPGYPDFEAGSHEFWTITNELMREAELFARDMLRNVLPDRA